MARKCLRMLLLSAVLASAVAGPMGPARAHGDEHEVEEPTSARGDRHGGGDDHSSKAEKKAGSVGNEDGVRTIEIDVSEDGFNGSSAPLRIVATEGEPVVLRFVYGDEAHGHENTHVIEVADLGLKTGKLDASNQVQELRFTPEKSGTFTFRCIYLCHGHANLQRGSLKVGAASTLATSLDLEVRPGGAEAQLVLMATVRDTHGRPVPGAPTHFLVESSLFGDMVDVGEAVTDEEGAAMLPFTPTVSGPTRFEARFEGQEAFEASHAATEYRITRAVSGPLAESEGFRLPWARAWMIFVLIGAVWLAYGFALMQLRRLARR